MNKCEMTHFNEPDHSDTSPYWIKLRGMHRDKTLPKLIEIKDKS